MTAVLASCVALLGPFAVWRWLVERRRRDELCDQLEHLVSAARDGLPLYGVLQALADEAPGLRRPWKLRASARAAHAEGTLTAAVEARPRWCPRRLRRLIRQAEARETLVPALELAHAELAEGPLLRAESLQRVGYPAILIAVVLWMALFVDDVIAPKMRMIGDDYGVELWSASATTPITWLLATLTITLAIWVACLALPPLRGLLVGLAGWLPGLRGWARARLDARDLGHVGALLPADGTLGPALESAAELGGGRRLRAAAALAQQGASLESVLAVVVGRRDLPRLLLLTRAHGVSAGLLLYAERLRDESRRRLGWVGEVLQPLPTVLCGLVVLGLAQGVFGSLGGMVGWLSAPERLW